jgi:hypothetical protein
LLVQSSQHNSVRARRERFSSESRKGGGG